MSAILILSRAVPALRLELGEQPVVQPPIPDAAPWAVLLRPFLWLMVVPALTAVIASRHRSVSIVTAALGGAYPPC